MKKMYLPVSVLILICIVLPGLASADYGYTSVSDIPGASHFSFRVDFDDNGLPHIVTDYPFRETGASELNIPYNRGSEYEVLTLNYRPSTGVTRITSFNGDIFKSNPAAEGAYEMIRNGELTPDDQICINTSHFNSQTDWFLYYSANAETYTAYAERTYAQAYNAMGYGGVEKMIFYQGGNIVSSRMLKRIDDADLLIEYDADGEIMYANISRYGSYNDTHDYDSYTGKFGRYTISELGFEESDLKAEAPAAIGTRTETLVGSEPRVAADPDTLSSPVFFGSMMAGIVIGLVLVKKFRSWRAKKKQAALEQESIRNQENKTADTSETPAPAEAPQRTYMSSGR